MQFPGVAWIDLSFFQWLLWVTLRQRRMRLRRKRTRSTVEMAIVEDTAPSAIQPADRKAHAPTDAEGFAVGVPPAQKYC